MPLKARLLRREVLPFVASFALLAASALALDGLLHLLGLLSIGRWLGIPGTLLIIGATAYSLRGRTRTTRLRNAPRSRRRAARRPSSRPWPLRRPRSSSPGTRTTRAPGP